MPEKFRPHYPSWQESKNAYNQVRSRFSVANKPKIWDHGAFAAHYQRILDNPDAAPYAKQHAVEALKNLGHRATPKQEREPGSDDEFVSHIEELAQA